MVSTGRRRLARMAGHHGDTGSRRVTPTGAGVWGPAKATSGHRALPALAGRSWVPDAPSAQQARTVAYGAPLSLLCRVADELPGRRLRAHNG
ncbi:hypothetical protein GTY65_34230 [Streptomyces sp. SID8379]|uniref:hypothetical protein n=1 Tax=unclassified Streptomyces TaxID=2593676 RepID=UPI00131A0B21|nr:MULTISPECIES: hypothetical protein [unclassified Streptomyces]MYW69094.1 hypothetical protein [Streptomyces sp. SID8379]